MKKYYFIAILALSFFSIKPSQKTIETPELIIFMSELDTSLKNNDQVDFIETLKGIYNYKENKKELSKAEFSDYQALILKSKLVFKKLFPQGIFPEDTVALNAFDEEFSEDIWDEDDDNPKETQPYDGNKDKLNHFNNFFANEVDPEMFLMKLADFFQFKKYLEDNPSLATNIKTELDSTEKTAALKFKKFFPGKTYPSTLNEAQYILNQVQETLYPALKPTNSNESSFPPAPALPKENLNSSDILQKALELSLSELLEALSHAHTPELPKNQNFSNEEKEFLKQLNSAFDNFEILLKKTIAAKSFSNKKINADISDFIKNKLIELAAFI